jgi:hypothetical protein
MQIPAHLMGKNRGPTMKVILGFSLMLGILAQGMVSSALADTEPPELINRPFAYFGAGTEFIHFSENFTLAGKKIKSGFGVFNPIQSSGGYVPVTSRTGLYLTGSKTLATIAGSESWAAEGIGTIQQVATKISLIEVDAMGVYHLKPGHHLLGGVNYTSLTFNRFNFNPAAGTDAFNIALGFGTLSDWVAAGNDPSKFPGLNPNPAQGTISEDINSLVAMVGYQYDTFFAIPDAPYRFYAGVKAGVPLLHMVENTSFPDVTLTSFMDAGYDLGANIGVGWNFSKTLSILGSVDWMYKHRFRITEGNLISPENDLHSAQTTLRLNWAF